MMTDSEALTRRTSQAMRAELLVPTADKALAKRVTEFLDLRKRATAAASIATSAEDLLRVAESADRQAAAEAVLAGNNAADVGTPHQDEAKAKVAAADVEFTALSDALEATWAELRPDYRTASQAEEDAARTELAARRTEVEAALDAAMKALGEWRATARRVVYFHDVRVDGRFNYSPAAPIGIRGMFIDRRSLDSSDVRREIQSVHDLLDPPVRRVAEPPQHVSAKAPARVR